VGEHQDFGAEVTRGRQLQLSAGGKRGVNSEAQLFRSGNYQPYGKNPSPSFCSLTHLKAGLRETSGCRGAPQTNPTLNNYSCS